MKFPQAPSSRSHVPRCCSLSTCPATSERSALIFLIDEFWGRLPARQPGPEATFSAGLEGGELLWRQRWRTGAHTHSVASAGPALSLPVPSGGLRRAQAPTPGPSTALSGDKVLQELPAAPSGKWDSLWFTCSAAATRTEPARHAVHSPLHGRASCPAPPHES